MNELHKKNPQHFIRKKMKDTRKYRRKKNKKDIKTDI